MKNLFSLLLMIAAPLAHAATITVNSGQSQSTIQGLINGATPGTDTVLFSAGTYAVTSGYTLKCGVTYTGPTVTLGTNGLATPTAILAASTRGTYNIFNLFSTGGTFTNPCTQATVIEYINFANTGGIYVRTSFTNLTIQYNSFTNIPCCGGGPAGTGIFFDGGQSTSNTAQSLTSSVINWNTVGDANSCLTPSSAFDDVSSPDGNGNAGQCNGILYETTMNGVTTHNNDFVHVSEGAHVTCPNPPGNNTNGQQQYCEPVDNGVLTDNLDFQFNDFNQNHRINYEEQPQTTSGVVWKNNSIHDMLSPAAFSFGLSFACCGSGGTSPFLNVSDNVVALNTVVQPNAGNRYGYGIEAWGRTATYDNNWVGVNGNSSIGIAWATLGGDISHNTVCGTGFAQHGYVATEGESFATGPTTSTGNTTSSSCAAYPSIAPTISPAAGNATFPLTVTLTDAGYTSGPVPQGNTGIWYTTDGSNPVPGSGTAKYLSTGGTFSLASAGTVRAVGMWGAQNQPTSYPAGMGFTPSAVISAAYTGGGPPPVLNGVSLACGATTVQVGSSLQCTATCSYNSGAITYNCSTTDPAGTDATFLSSNTADFVVNASGTITGVAAGTANLTATAGSFTSSPVSITVTAPAPVLSGAFITCGGINTLNVGQSLQCTANCQYTGISPTNCTTTDPYGNVATGWLSSNSGQLTVTSGGLVAGVSAGTPNIRFSVGTFPSNEYIFTVSSSPPAATLVSVAITGGNTLTAGQTLPLGASCTYSDATVTNCTTTDAHGNVATGWTSSLTSVATINSTTGVLSAILAGVTNINVAVGSVHAPALPFTVTAAPTVTICGNNQVTPGLTLSQASTFPNFFNSTYCVTGTSVGANNSTSGAFYLPAGTQVLGGLWDLVVIPATSGTAQAAAAVCKGTYTNTSTTGPGAFVTVAIGMANSPSTACHLPPSTAYWIGLITNQSPGPVAEGFWTCNGTTTPSCAGSLGSGTYPSLFVSNVYGTYTGMTTTLTNGGDARQASQYLVLNQPPPTLTGGFLQPTPITLTQTTVGATVQYTPFCQYSDGSTNVCATPDIYGNTVTVWGSSNTSVFTIGSVGSPHPGLALGVSGGNANVQATLTGGVVATPTRLTVQTMSSAPVPGSPRIFSR